MHILYLARLVLVQLGSELRTLKRFVCFAFRFCTFGFCILLCLQHLFSFFNRRTYSSGNNIFFLNLIKIECIVSELFKSSVKFVSANSFVCRFISQQCVSLFHIVSREFLKRRVEREKKEKCLIVRSHCR